MTVPIDSSRTYQWPSELVELIEAVTRTDPNNESTWIEWKSTLDLGDKPGHCHVAKHVLGFANRAVATARLHAGGHAYMIVGAEPGNLSGITSVDPAVLRPQIQRYVGPAVRWRAEYVSVQGQQVLVVVVDPPQHGDPIYPVRHQLDVHPKGRVLVRHQGSTDPADDFEIDQLVQRVRAGEGGLDFSIQPSTPVIERRLLPPNADELAEAERAATLARPRADAPRPLDEYLSPVAAVAQAGRLLGMFQTPDDRSDEDYKKEVDSYCERYKHAVIELYLWRLWRHQPACLQLEAVNLTEANFTDIELEIHIPGDVRVWRVELKNIALADKPALPLRPTVLGTPKKVRPFDSPDYNVFMPAPPSIGPLKATGPTFTARDSGSVTISFARIDLRPHQLRVLPGVRLLVAAPEGSVLDCTWNATASNARGQQTGSFALTVCASTMDFKVIDECEADVDGADDLGREH